MYVYIPFVRLGFPPTTLSRTILSGEMVGTANRGSGGINPERLVAFLRSILVRFAFARLPAAGRLRPGSRDDAPWAYPVEEGKSRRSRARFARAIMRLFIANNLLNTPRHLVINTRRPVN